MDLKLIWSAIWNNTPFHWLVLLVFWGAVLAEFYHLSRDRAETHQTQAALNFLKSWRRERISLPPEKLYPWLSQHIQLDEQGKPQQQQGLFVLLQSPQILQRSRRSSLRFVPGLCTAIGILGTFYGIQMGLQGVNLGFSNSTQLLEGVKTLLIGMKTAFSSSLMGLGLGSGFTLVLFVSDSLKQHWRDRLRSQIEGLFWLGSSQSERPPEFAPQAIGEAVGEQVATQLAPAFRDIARSLKVLEEIQGDRAGEEVKSAIAAIAVQVDTSRECTQQLADSVQTLSEKLDRLAMAIATFQEQAIGELQQVSQRFQHTLTQFESETERVLRQTAREIHRGVEGSIAGMEAQRNAFSASAAEATETFRHLRQQLQESLRDRAEIEGQMLQQLHNRTVEILAQAQTTFQQQSETLQTVGSEASSLMREAKSELIGELQEMEELLLNANQTMQEYLEQFSLNYQSSLQDFFAQSIKIVDGQRRAFREDTADAADAFAELRQGLKDALKTQARIERELLEKVQVQLEKLIADLHHS